MAVTATGDRDTRASFANFGAKSVDLAAPGAKILSTLPGSTYGSYSGTSMATPQVAGVAALVKSQNPVFNDGKIKARFLNTVDKKTSLNGKVLTGGRLNAARAVGQATTATKDSREPTITRLRPVSDSIIRNRTSLLAATVRDDSNLLSTTPNKTVA